MGYGRTEIDGGRIVVTGHDITFALRQFFDAFDCADGCDDAGEHGLRAFIEEVQRVVAQLQLPFKGKCRRNCVDLDWRDYAGMQRFR